MSETETEERNAPAPGTGEAPAPAEGEDGEREGRGDKRFHRLSARLTSVVRERDQLAAQIAALQQQNNPSHDGAPLDPRTREQIQQEANRIAHEGRMQEKSNAFHAAGNAAYDDWPEKCQTLMNLGADPQFAELLLDIPNGHQVAAALVDNPDEVEQIASIRSERGRALALGRFAASLEKDDSKPAARQRSNAPRPPTPPTARSSPQFNEYTADAQTLARHYMRQNLEKTARK